MANHIDGIDHVLIAARDLEAARRTYHRLGFTITPHGRHIGWSTGNYCVMFRDDYLELIGVVDSTQPASSTVRRIAERGDGMIGVALATTDAEAAHRDLTAAGFNAEFKSLGRALDLPEGTVTPRFQLVQLGADETPAVPMFLCQHLSPELVRRPAWLDHPNTARGVRSVLIAVADPDVLVDIGTRLFGGTVMVWTDRALGIRLGRATLVFAALDDVADLYPDIDPASFTPPSMIAMTIGVADIGAAAAHLTRGGIAHVRDGSTSLVVAPGDAGGVILEFAADRD